jgi:hypothetical protein
MEDQGQKDLPGKKPEYSSLQEQEHVTAFQRYIFQGGKLITGGKFPEAIKYFRNKEEVGKVGLTLDIRAHRLRDSILPENVESDANWIARKCWFMHRERIIQVSGAYSGDKNIMDIPAEQMNQAEKAMAHEVALLHMEEYLHALQYFRNSPVAGFADSEVDVAAYMQKNGIPMTPAFLRRYDRGFYLSGDEGIDDSLSKVPAIRRGVFVNVKRSDGKIESDWQISGFNNQTGDAIVRNYAQGLEKQIPNPELSDLNPEGVYPFVASKDFQETFSAIDRLKRIQGTNDVYDATELKKLINRVRSGNENINKIPRSGGLRLKVAELLNIKTAAVSEPTIRLS